MIAQDRIEPGATMRCRFPMRGRFIFARYELVEYSPAFLQTDSMRARAWAVVRLNGELVAVREFDLHPDDYETLWRVSSAIYARVGRWFRVTEDGLQYQ